MTPYNPSLFTPNPSPQLLRDISPESDPSSAPEASPSIDARFLSLLPLPRAFDFSELLGEVRRHRRLLIRAETAIPLTALLALLGALLFHGVIIGTFLLGLYILPHAPPLKGGHNRQGIPDIQTTYAGYMFLGDLNPPSPIPSTPATPTPPIPPAPVALPPVPADPVTPAPSPQLALNTLAQPPDTSEIGIPSGNDAILPPHVPAPIPTDPSAAPPLPSSPLQGLPIQPPSTDIRIPAPAPSSLAHASRPSTSGGPQLARGSPDSDDDQDADPIISLENTPYHGGNGRNANGALDRGESGADIPEPRLVDQPRFRFPDQYLHNPPAHEVIFRVTVDASGKISSIKQQQSSGDDSLDALCRSVVEGYKFWPAYKAGRPIIGYAEVHFGVQNK